MAAPLLFTAVVVITELTKDSNTSEMLHVNDLALIKETLGKLKKVI